MSLTLYYHPLSSFCHKALIALYEKDLAFTPRLVDFANQDARNAFLSLWPIGKIPVLHDAANDRVVAETTIIIEYLESLSPAPRLFPLGASECLDARLWDRFYDLYVQVPMQKIVADRLRQDADRDAFGVAEAHAMLATAYGMIERQVSTKQWASGETFGIADCAAAPALFYASIVHPFDPTHRHTQAYFERLLARVSVKRVLEEARPYFKWFPYAESIPHRFLNAIG
jgi:glutathione S-transferase